MPSRVTGNQKKFQPPFPSCLESGLSLAAGKNVVCFPRKNPVPKTCTPVSTAVLLFSLICFLGWGAFAQDAAPTEYQIKAAFLYNFVKFVDWPPQSFATPSSPIVIGVLGENVFGDNLEQAVHDKIINNHPLQYKKFDSVAEATNCQVLFISASEKNRFPQILDTLRGRSILTVSESDRFIAAGGIINFVIVNNRVRFQINNESARKAGLTISSDLLNLAVPH